jgi:hypothetical protein
MVTGAGDPTATRKLFEEWCAPSEADGGALEDDDRSVSLQTHYVLFEIEYGSAVRALWSTQPLVVCPQNTQVRAECVLVEVRLGDDAGARTAFDHVLAGFADDEEATRQFTLRCGEEVPT